MAKFDGKRWAELSEKRKRKEKLSREEKLEWHELDAARSMVRARDRMARAREMSRRHLNSIRMEIGTIAVEAGLGDAPRERIRQALEDLARELAAGDGFDGAPDAAGPAEAPRRTPGMSASSPRSRPYPLAPSPATGGSPNAPGCRARRAPSARPSRAVPMPRDGIASSTPRAASARRPNAASGPCSRPRASRSSSTASIWAGSRRPAPAPEIRERAATGIRTGCAARKRPRGRPGAPETRVPGAKRPLGPPRTPHGSHGPEFRCPRSWGDPGRGQDPPAPPEGGAE